MVTQDADRAETLSRSDDVRDALEQAGATARPGARLQRQDVLVLAASAAGVLLLTALRASIDLPPLAWLGRWREPLGRACAAGVVIALVLGASRIAQVWLVAQVEDRAARYNLRRVVRLVAILAIGFALLSALFANWTTAAVSLGLISLVLGFALQTPITSFIGWLYLLVRRPYTVGHRIKVGAIAGDVIDVGYFDTTLWEFGGEYLSTDHPSGRIIRFPNSKVLEEPVINYSWPLFPFIWNEVKVQLAYESDLELVARILQEAAEAEVGPGMHESVRAYRLLLARTPVDHLEVKERPVVFFRVSELTWIEGIVRYLVHPREAGGVKSRIIRTVLSRMNEHPDKVLFPKGATR
jgi:small-conductance mechanosensitive channel